MTDLTVSLLATGGAFLVALIIYNKWQEYKARKSVEQAFSGGHDDVLMNPDEQASNDYGHVRHEPRMEQREPGEPEMEDDFPNTDRMIRDHADPYATPQTHSERELAVDDVIDCVIPLEFEAPVRGERVLSAIGALKFVGRKPVHFIGMDQAGNRDHIAHGGIYTILYAGVQMVNRSGPLNELEYSEFVGKLREISEQLNAHSEIPDMNHVMATSKELHQFVSEHDAQLSVNILANGAPWAINTLLAALEKQGFDVRPDGRLVMPDGDGGNLFSLSTNVSVADTTTSRLTLLLDVPCVAPARNGFGAMSACARSLATRLAGTVVDDGNQTISKTALDEIAGQVDEFCAAMAEAQIPAGSLRAQRLFS
jgi:FtsZ-interacting cell division protein ZipA